MATISIPIIFGIGMFSSVDVMSYGSEGITKSAETNEYKTTNQRYGQFIIDLKNTNNDLSKQVKDLRVQLETQQSTQLVSSSDDSELKMQLDSLENENSRILKENMDLEREIDELSSNSKEKQPSESETMKLEDKISQLEKDLTKEKSKKVVRDRTEKEERLEGDLSKALRENQELKNEVKKLKKEVDDLKEK